MTPPRVSIIVNTRNGEEYLREALDSALMQTFRDWELILWDDNSSDGTRKIAEAYGDRRIRRTYCDEDVSLSVARHRAITEARGDWLAFLDQDDVWTSDKLERQLALDAEGVGLIYGRAVCLRGGSIGPDADHKHEYQPLPEGDILRSLLLDSCYITMSAAMLRARAVREAAPTPEAIQVTPDYDWFLTLSARWRARAVQDTVCLYRIHGSSMTISHGRRMHEEILLLLDRWGGRMTPAELRRRTRVHQSHLALLETLRERRPVAALRRLLARGSVLYLLGRPFARAARAVRRRIFRPEWRRAADRVESRPGRPPIVGTLVTSQNFRGAVAAVERMVKERRPEYVSASNAFGVTLARRDPRYRSLLNNAAMVTADGMPIVWMLKRLGWAAERVHNDDLVLEACASNPDWRIALVGGREGQPEAAGRQLSKRCRVDIVATFPTPERPVLRERTDEILAGLRDARPDLVLVGMGTPAQDLWMAGACRDAGLPMIGCGSLFDLLIGRTRPTPEWLKRAGFQWLYRLSQEPRRLLKRYLVFNTLFVIAAARQLLSTVRKAQS